MRSWSIKMFTVQIGYFFDNRKNFHITFEQRITVFKKVSRKKMTPHIGTDVSNNFIRIKFHTYVL